MNRIRALWAFLLLFASLSANDTATLCVDLFEPSYSDGTLITERGGVIEGAGLRIQADKISYTKTDEKEIIIASGNLMVEYDSYTFLGEEIFYNVREREGDIFFARTEIEPWIIGGERIHFCQGGALLLYNGYATTSQAPVPEWSIHIAEGDLQDLRYLTGRGAKANIYQIPILWIPQFQFDLKTITDFPFRYKLRIGGVQDSLFGLTYELWSWRGWQTFLTFDYRFNRGPGGGFETYYRSPGQGICFHSLGYIADDRSDANPYPTTRYRLQGYYRQYLDDSTKIFFTYDWLSDENMATDYADRGLRLEAAKKTELHIRRQRPNWITNFYTNVRINDFQTVKQELPRVDYTVRPFTFFNTGIITEASASASFLDFEYSNNQNFSNDYHSPRLECNTYSYRPIHWNAFHFTPGAGVVSIFYGNNQQGYERWTVLGLFENLVTTDFNRTYGQCKHVITPYAHYQYFTTPSTNPNDFLVFDIADGWYYLNQLRFGVRQNLYCRLNEGFLYRPLEIDIYANAFYHTDTIPKVVPKVYFDATLWPSRCVRYQLQTAWDFDTNQLDHFNTLIEWTMSNDIAFSMEWRHRSPYDWR
ncbi:MAG: hypothetical protein WD595_01330, partial [Waddliaceae bacterium]